MHVSKLKAMRAGHRGTITNFLGRISETNNEDEHSAMIKILEEKQDTLEKINSQILQELSSEEEIQMEIRDSVEYMSHLRLRLAELTKSASSTKTLENVHQSTSINLNVNAQEFAQCNDTSQGNSGIPKTHYTVDKKDDDDIWDLQSLRRAVKVEPTGQASNLRSSQEFIPAANLVAGSSHKRINNPQNFVKLCLFCNENHSPTTCHIIQDCEVRIFIIKEKRVCFNCLGKHKVNNCQSRFKCRICKKTHHTSICYKSQFLKPSSKSSVKNLERTKETESLLLEQSIQLHFSKQLNGDRCKEEEKVPTSKETNKLNTKLQKRETAQSRTEKQKKSASNTVVDKKKEDQAQEDLVEKLKSEILQLRRENFKLRRNSSFKNHKIQKIQRENSVLEQRMKILEDLNNQLQAQMLKIQSNVETCSETFTTSANKDTADLRHYLDELELRVINLEMGKNVTSLEEIMKQNSALMTQLWELDPYTHNNLEKFKFYRALEENNIHHRHYHKRAGTTFNEFKIGKLVQEHNDFPKI
ncbi:uncharacterized protein [Magallana gigas]|uniref:uncharacterized protein n=1 Tax=Magallana gigas TaxID=29159 RepID=UPI00334262BD